jgi:hypothetical protein
MPDERPVYLWNGRDDRGTRSIWATRLSDGRLRIESQDLGPAVAIFGEGLSEYEWAWTVAAEDVLRIAELLGSPAAHNPIAVMRAWVQQGNGRDPGVALKEAGLSLEFWSRIGD